MNLATQVDMLAGYKLHYRTVFQGIPVSIENRKGSIRRGVDPGGKPWATKMHVPYGRLSRGANGADGEKLDIFLGPNKAAKHVFIAQIMKPPKFQSKDEEKVFLGFNSVDDAARCFAQHYDNPKFLGGFKTVGMDQFKQKALGTKDQPTKMAAALELLGWGEPNSGVANVAHIEPIISTSPPSLKKPYYVPSPNDPREKDNRYGDVDRRKRAQKFREELMRHHGSDQRDRPVGTTQVSGFPSVSIGGFG